MSGCQSCRFIVWEFREVFPEVETRRALDEFRRCRKEQDIIQLVRSLHGDTRPTRPLKHLCRQPERPRSVILRLRIKGVLRSRSLHIAIRFVIAPNAKDRRILLVLSGKRSARTGPETLVSVARWSTRGTRRGYIEP